MQDHGKEIVEMKAVEVQRRVVNHPTRDVCFHGSNKYTNGSNDNFVFVYLVFYLLLTCNIIEETLVAHRKCEDLKNGTRLSILKLYSTNF